MRATYIATVVLAMAVSPVALAQTTSQSTTPPAATTPASPAPNSTQANQLAQTNSAMSDEERERARTRLGAGAAATGNMPDHAGAAMKQLTVDDLEDMDVYNAQGERVGEVEEIVSGAGNQRYVVISEGGFFGMGEDHAAFPLERFWVQGDRLVVQGVTDADIDSMSNYRGKTSDYNEVDDDERIDMATWPQS